jgi:hypothetical protein
MSEYDDDREVPMDDTDLVVLPDVLPSQTRDDTDEGWGDREEHGPAYERPPHYE